MPETGTEVAATGMVATGVVAGTVGATGAAGVATTIPTPTGILTLTGIRIGIRTMAADTAVTHIPTDTSPSMSAGVRLLAGTRHPAPSAAGGQRTRPSLTQAG